MSEYDYTHECLRLCEENIDLLEAERERLRDLHGTSCMDYTELLQWNAALLHAMHEMRERYLEVLHVMAA